MKNYRYLKDIWERGEDIFVTMPRHCGYSAVQKINMSARQMLGEKYIMLKAPRDLSSQSISNCRVPIDVLMYFTKKDKLVDELLRRRQWEEYFDKLLDFYDRIFTYTIDGKEVSAREFYEYVRVDGKVKMASTYGEMVTKKERRLL